MIFPADPATPIGDSVGTVPHMLPEHLDRSLARRLRSRECLTGERDGACTDPTCLCACHGRQVADGQPDWRYMLRTVDTLDGLIDQGRRYLE